MTMAMEFPANVEELQLYFSEEIKRASTRNSGLDIPIWILGSSTESLFSR
jgi:hypothetical protein